MRNEWNLHIRNFGKIKEAKITVSPFMIFVGANNSGKSYVMELLWGIINNALSLIQKNCVTHKRFQEIHSELLAQVGSLEENTHFAVSEEIQASLLCVFNDVLQERKEILLKDIFNYPVSIESLWLERESFPTVTVSVDKNESFISENLRLVAHAKIDDTVLRIASFPQKIAERLTDEIVQLVLMRVLLTLVCQGFYSQPLDRTLKYQPIYFPASRAGFMNTYRAIVGNVFEAFVSNRTAEQLQIDFDLEGDQKSDTSIPGAALTLPTTLFLSKLQKHDYDEAQLEKYKDEIEFLNKQVLRGRIVKDERNEFRFVPDQSTNKLPLHVTSSLVAEISPLVIFLASHYDPDLWIIEELEAHLHSEMQLEVTRLLFRLLNKGKAIWLTTHSDNLAQQINNLLTLSRHPHQEAILEKLNYSKQELLADVSIANAYQFESIDGVTKIEQLELGDYGFVMNTFNDTLGRLIKETDIIQNFAEEQRD